MISKRVAIVAGVVCVQTVVAFTGPPWLRAALVCLQCGIVGYSLGSLAEHKRRLEDHLRHVQQVQDMDAIMGKLIELMRSAGWDIPSWPGSPLTDEQKAGLN
jgi:hypothetical protein